MMAIEVAAFRLRDPAQEGAFLAADDRVQKEFFYQRLGIVRRTTARGRDGEWLVVTMWWSEEEAEAAATAAALDPVHTAFMAHIAPDSYTAKRFVSLD